MQKGARSLTRPLPFPQRDWHRREWRSASALFVEPFGQHAFEERLSLFRLISLPRKRELQPFPDGSGSELSKGKHELLMKWNHNVSDQDRVNGKSQIALAMELDIFAVSVIYFIYEQNRWRGRRKGLMVLIVWRLKDWLHIPWILLINSKCWRKSQKRGIVTLEPALNLRARFRHLLQLVRARLTHNPCTSSGTGQDMTSFFV